MSRFNAKFPVILTSAVVAIAALLCGASSAQAGDDALHFDITPYVWLPSVDNHLDVKGVPVEFGTNTKRIQNSQQARFCCGDGALSSQGTIRIAL